MTSTEVKGREFEILAIVAEQIDELPEDKRKQVMAMLAARYGLIIRDRSNSGAHSGYGAWPNRKYSKGS
jgi:hypothetical protein